MRLCRRLPRLAGWALPVLWVRFSPFRGPESLLSFLLKTSVGSADNRVRPGNENRGQAQLGTEHRPGDSSSPGPVRGSPLPPAACALGGARRGLASPLPDPRRVQLCAAGSPGPSRDPGPGAGPDRTPGPDAAGRGGHSGGAPGDAGDPAPRSNRPLSVPAPAPAPRTHHLASLLRGLTSSSPRPWQVRATESDTGKRTGQVRLGRGAAKKAACPAESAHAT